MTVHKTRRKIGKKQRRKYQRSKTQRGGNGRLSPPPVSRPCNPKVLLDRTTVSHDTCLTNPLLQKLIEMHNKFYPKSKIDKNLPANRVLAILREKNRDCNSDKCLLKKAGLEKHSDEVFAPQHDWKKPREWLSNFNIKDVMDMYSHSYPHFHFFGPVPIDFDSPDVCPRNGYNLCHFNLEKELSSGKTKFGFIFNLDFDKGSGTHWVSMFYDASPKNPKNSLLFFFDSAGKNNTPDDRFEHIYGLANSIILQAKTAKKYTELSKNPPVLIFNKTRHQSGDTECGVYSIFFILTMLTRKPDVSQNNELTNAELIDLFMGKHGVISDNYIEQYRKVFFTEPVS